MSKIEGNAKNEIIIDGNEGKYDFADFYREMKYHAGHWYKPIVPGMLIVLRNAGNVLYRLSAACCLFAEGFFSQRKGSASFAVKAAYFSQVHASRMIESIGAYPYIGLIMMIPGIGCVFALCISRTHKRLRNIEEKIPKAVTSLDLRGCVMKGKSLNLEEICSSKVETLYLDQENIKKMSSDFLLPEGIKTLYLKVDDLSTADVRKLFKAVKSRKRGAKCQIIVIGKISGKVDLANVTGPGVKTTFRGCDLSRISFVNKESSFNKEKIGFEGCYYREQDLEKFPQALRQCLA